VNAKKIAKISDYGLIGDGRTAALISSSGSVDWCCFPQFDSSSYFGALVDPERGGHFSLAPSEPFQSVQRYIEDTNILETIFTTHTGVVRLLDCFSVTTEERKNRQLWPDHEILRILECVEGHVSMETHYAPRPNFATRPFQFTDRGRFGIGCSCNQHILLLQACMNGQLLKWKLEDRATAMIADFVLKNGEQAQFSLTYADEAPAIIPPLGEPAKARMEETTKYWRNWLGQCQYKGPYSAEVRRSALALKLLIFAPSGAIIAAPTTSLPETLGGERNWDYRYCWLRDASFTVRALVDLGFKSEASAFVSWMLHATRLTRPKLQVLYSVYGETTLKERVLNHLSGYQNSIPVRVGNAAHEQFQLDVYGEVLDAIHRFAPFFLEIDRETRDFILDMGQVVCKQWDKPDDGIWEVRSGRAHHTHSKVLAWTALDRLVKIGKSFDWKAPYAQFNSTALEIRNAIEAHGFNPTVGAYTREFGGNELDAAVLVMPLLGYCNASSPRMMSTCRVIGDRLSKNGLIYRYLDVDDGLRGAEGSFGICNFWMAENFARAGHVSHAIQWFETLISKGNTVGLWSEEIDPDSGEFLGNYPQAFTHIGLINAAVTLLQSQKGVQEK